MHKERRTGAEIRKGGEEQKNNQVPSDESFESRDIATESSNNNHRLHRRPVTNPAEVGSDASREKKREKEKKRERKREREKKWTKAEGKKQPTIIKIKLTQRCASARESDNFSLFPN